MQYRFWDIRRLEKEIMDTVFGKNVETLCHITVVKFDDPSSNNDFTISNSSKYISAGCSPDNNKTGQPFWADTQDASQFLSVSALNFILHILHMHILYTIWQ